MPVELESIIQANIYNRTPGSYLYEVKDVAISSVSYSEEREMYVVYFTCPNDASEKIAYVYQDGEVYSIWTLD